jgi:CheY-like chemotaxis protein
MRSKHARLSDWLSGGDASSSAVGAAEEPFDSFGPIDDRRPRAQMRRAPAPLSPHEIPRILMAEADAYHRRVLRVLLASPNLSVIEVEDGQSAIDLLSLRSFDVILLGMNLPIMTGADVLRWVRRSQTPWADIPIIGLIDDAHRDQVGRLMSMGLTDWTPKPLSRTELANKLVNFLPALAGSGL